MSSAVIDPDGESVSFCMDCAEKHIGQGSINIGEALDRIRNLTDLDNEQEIENLVDFVLRHVNKAQSELAEVETHVKNATDAEPEQREALDNIANEARIIRDKLRNFNKTFPQEPELDLILQAQQKAKRLNDTILFTKKKFGCGMCLANKGELERIKLQLLEGHQQGKVKIPQQKQQKEEFPTPLDVLFLPLKILVYPIEQLVSGMKMGKE